VRLARRAWDNLQAVRPIDLARGIGLSTQAVRNYEAAGILPDAHRTRHGYRVYTPLHAQALETFAALVPAHGHATATAIMRAANDGAVAEVLRLLDGSHVQLLKDRQTLAAVTEALPRLAPVPTNATTTFVGPLAHQLGLRPATLRKWERAGLVHPHRDRRTGYRRYSPDDVRDARLAHQLRRGGYPLKKIAVLLEQVRAAGGVEPLQATLGEWHHGLTARGRAMLAGAAALHAYLTARDLALLEPG
jgi:DNA-binding transcriptional MerR regulator